jgi:hypothetical protein
VVFTTTENQASSTNITMTQQLIDAAQWFLQQQKIKQVQPTSQCSSN